MNEEQLKLLMMMMWCGWCAGGGDLWSLFLPARIMRSRSRIARARKGCDDDDGWWMMWKQLKLHEKQLKLLEVAALLLCAGVVVIFDLYFCRHALCDQDQESRAHVKDVMFCNLADTLVPKVLIQDPRADLFFACTRLKSTIPKDPRADLFFDRMRLDHGLKAIHRKSTIPKGDQGSSRRSLFWSHEARSWPKGHTQEIHYPQGGWMLPNPLAAIEA